MTTEKASDTTGLGWWALVAALIIGCIGLYLAYAPRARPVIHPVTSSAGQ